MIKSNIAKGEGVFGGRKSYKFHHRKVTLSDGHMGYLTLHYLYMGVCLRISIDKNIKIN